jgi:hypothetical protein
LSAELRGPSKPGNRSVVFVAVGLRDLTVCANVAQASRPHGFPGRPLLKKRSVEQQKNNAGNGLERKKNVELKRTDAHKRSVRKSNGANKHAGRNKREERNKLVNGALAMGPRILMVTLSLIHTLLWASNGEQREMKFAPRTRI